MRKLFLLFFLTMSVSIPATVEGFGGPYDTGRDVIAEYPNLDTDSTDDVSLGETSGTAHRGDHGKTAYDHSQDNSQAHSDYLLNSGGDTGAGTYIFGTVQGVNVTSGSDPGHTHTVYETDTKCMYWEDPTADDDFKSIWRPKGFAATITSIWAESDQTVTFMLQVDDGSPSDVDTVDLAPAAGTAEDTSLDGDATMADGDRLDMAVTSVANTPTWCSVCWTYTKDD